MAQDTLTNLQTRINEGKSENKPGKNTKIRVFQLMLDILDTVKGWLSKLNFDIDANGKRITNLLAAVGATEPVRKQEFDDKSALLAKQLEVDLMFQNVLRLNGTDSYVSLANAHPIDSSNIGRYEMLLKLPTETTANKILFSYGGKIMININLGYLSIYYSNSGGAIGQIPIASYAGKKIKLTIRKLATSIEVLFDSIYQGIWNITDPVVSADATLFIGSYAGTALFSAIDLYFFRVYNEVGNVVMNIDAASNVILSNVKKIISGDNYFIDKESSVILNGTTSLIQINCTNAVKQGNTNETYQIVCKLPVNVTANQSLLSCGIGSFSAGIYNGNLIITNEGVAAMYPYPITSYAGKEVVITIVRNINSFQMYIGAVLLTPNSSIYSTLNASDRILIGAYSGNILQTPLDVKAFRKWNVSLTQNDISYLCHDILNNSIQESFILFDFKNKGIATNGWEDYYNVAKATFINCVVVNPNRLVASTPISVATSLLAAIPSTIKSTTISEFNLWLDNVILDYEHSGFRVEAVIAGSEVRPMNRAIRMTFATVGAKNITLNVYDIANNIVESKVITVNVISATAGSGTLQFLFIGDSTIDDAMMTSPGVKYYEHEGPEIVSEFYKLCDANKGFTPLMIGHKKNYPPYNHAGMSGWDTTWFLNANSPFWYNGRNDFKHYVQTNIVGQAGAVDRVDFMILQIGINNLKNGAAASTVIKGIKTLIGQFATDYPTAKIIIGYSASGCDATGWSVHFFGNTSFVTFRKNMIELWKLIESEFNGNALYPNVYACNAGQWIDRVYGMPYKLLPVSARSTETQLTHWDSVHPAKLGYDQAADAYFAKVKSLV